MKNKFQLLIENIDTTCELAKSQAIRTVSKSSTETYNFYKKIYKERKTNV